VLVHRATCVLVGTLRAVHLVLLTPECHRSASPRSSSARTTHRPTPRWGGGARTPPAPSPPGGARGTSAPRTFICCSCFVSDVSREIPRRRHRHWSYLLKGREGISKQIAYGQLHSHTVVARPQARILPRVVAIPWCPAGLPLTATQDVTAGARVGGAAAVREQHPRARDSNAHPCAERSREVIRRHARRC
jgi:hypothetical protein